MRRVEKICIFGSAPRHGVGGCFPSVTEIGDTLFAEFGVLISIGVLISGNAEGADRCGEAWARHCGIAIERYPVTPAEWSRHGKAAGPLRNEKMASLLTTEDIALGFWDGQSRGTKDMERRLNARGVPCRVVLWSKP